jgi:DNA-binding transcriptional regulator YdaS (Cro superfamily)
MSYQSAEQKCLEIITATGVVKIALALGTKQPVVSQVKNGSRRLPPTWIDRILALEGLEVLVLQKTP